MNNYICNDRQFHVSDFSATHNQLLIRSYKSGENGYNVDLIFKGVNHMIMPTVFNGIIINLITDEFEIKQYRNKYKSDLSYGMLLFKVCTNGKEDAYVEGYCFGVYNNNLEIHESSIGRYDMDSLGELVYWCPE